MSVTFVKDRSDDDHVAHATQLAMQCAWTRWNESARPFDFSWKNLIYGPGSHIIKFVLNSSINCLRTPDMLRLWGYTNSAFCPLCGAKQCTQHHILSNCDVALHSGRYAWRHDSVLATALPAIQARVESANSRVRKPKLPPPIAKSFTSAGSRISSTKSVQRKSSLLDGARDWKLLVDFERQRIVFPPEIYGTSERPDIVIWSVSTRTVIMIELTCPSEEGFEAASVRKIDRYDALVQNIHLQKWKPVLMTVEVGVRGYVANSMLKCLHRLGFSNREVHQLRKAFSLVTARCSHGIYLSREIKHWDRQRELIVVPTLPSPVRAAVPTTPAHDSAEALKFLSTIKPKPQKVAIPLDYRYDSDGSGNLAQSSPLIELRAESPSSSSPEHGRVKPRQRHPPHQDRVKQLEHYKQQGYEFLMSQRSSATMYYVQKREILLEKGSLFGDHRKLQFRQFTPELGSIDEIPDPVVNCTV